ncbi:exosome complex component RRP43-like protein [Piptocephalis cylindrospora]|uniref:Ribosomal RNA-processing protein 43 n=1 Tax=Piptocephalis cylindrospora TaxID=1907219 RepID=A0A4P9Y7J2_9FUNG|nr:exosome complex component RRP43-like protein [Piptocephalis cylindrospora]|eukprot:RKP15013.1 exosome complex component RRP43-like protein [Piptocephalis cylindrospora]
MSSTIPPLPAEAIKKLLPETYHQSFIQKGVRPDGRGFQDFRPTAVHYGAITSADGSALVRLGGTTVVCGIKAEVAVPEPTQPTQGYFTPNVELGPMCSARFKPGAPSETAQVLSQQLNTLSLGVLDRDDLCIEPGQAVWALYADVLCLNYDGGALDACQLAVTAALRNLRLGKATFNEEEGAVRANARESQGVPIKAQVYTSTFGVLESGQCLADPSEAEGSLVRSTVSVSVSDQGRLVAVWKQGGQGCDVALIRACLDQAQERRAILESLLAPEASS